MRRGHAFVPADVDARASSHFDWREAESAYTFAKADEALRARPVFKRFTEEKTLPARYNHGFENMDSLGAVYSRASLHILGDWNACRKIGGRRRREAASLDRGPVAVPQPAAHGHRDDGSPVRGSALARG